jgi:hypothetical protein
MSQLTVDGLLKTAQQRTGLSDFGPDDFREGLDVLVEGLNTEAGIRADRWEQVREQRILRLLMNRLWFAKDLNDHPEILDEDLGAPVIMAGLPRTGSTKLHRILAATGGFQVLRFWSANMFARIPGEPDGGRARRIHETRAQEKWMYEASPGLHHGHPLYTDEAEEDQWIMEATFRHPVIFGLFDSPKYAKWIAQADMQPTFDYFLKQLKYLQWQFGERGKPWLIKTPPHLGSEEFLTGIFDKKPSFIFTHRDPAKCISSIVSTVMVMRMLYTDRDTSHTFGAGALAVFSHCANEHMKWRDTKPDNPMLDLGFRDITEHGVDTVRKVYAFLGMPFTDEAARGAQQWEAANPKDKHGKAAYSAAALGSTDEDIRRAFTTYIDRYSAYI